MQPIVDIDIGIDNGIDCDIRIRKFVFEYMVPFYRIFVPFNIELAA